MSISLFLRILELFRCKISEKNEKMPNLCDYFANFGEYEYGNGLPEDTI